LSVRSRTDDNDTRREAHFRSTVVRSFCLQRGVGGGRGGEGRRGRGAHLEVFAPQLDPPPRHLRLRRRHRVWCAPRAS